jgi:hypothetical protein
LKLIELLKDYNLVPKEVKKTEKISDLEVIMELILFTICKQIFLINNAKIISKYDD